MEGDQPGGRDPLRPLIIAIALLALLHHTDHVLRADHSGWPFQPEVTPFTYTLVIYPMLIVDYFARSRPRLRAGFLSLGVALLVIVHATIETPADLYRTWATGSSTSEANPEIPNLLEISSPLVGGLSVIVLAALLAALGYAIARVAGQIRSS